MAQDGNTFHTNRNHKLPYYPKEPHIFSFGIPIIRHHLFLPTLRQTFTRMIRLHPLTIINLNHMNLLTEKLLSILFSNRKLIAIRIFLTLILQTTLQIPVLAHLKKNMKCSKIQYKINFLLIHIH